MQFQSILLQSFHFDADKVAIDSQDLKNIISSYPSHENIKNGNATNHSEDGQAVQP